MKRTSNTNRQRCVKASRRQVLCLTGAGISLALGRSLPAAACTPETARQLKRGDKIDIDGKAEEIIQLAGNKRRPVVRLSRLMQHRRTT